MSEECEVDPRPCPGYRRRQVLFLEKGGARSYLNVLLDLLLGWEGVGWQMSLR